jgi:hypothetical protein
VLNNLAEMNKNNYCVGFMFSNEIRCDYGDVSDLLYIEDPVPMILVANKNGEIIAWKSPPNKPAGFTSELEEAFLMIPALNQSAGRVAAMCTLKMPISSLIVKHSSLLMTV